MKKKNIISLVIFFMMFLRGYASEKHSSDIVVPSGVEICDNGIDDDCDGLVDCFDPDCSGVDDCTSEVSGFFYGLPVDTCSFSNFPSTNPNSGLFVEWSFDSIAGRLMVIGDLDNDNVSEIVVTSSSDILVLDGRNGTVKRRIPMNGFRIEGLVIGDADENGFGEIYYSSGILPPPAIVSQTTCYDYGTNSNTWTTVYTNSVGTPLSITNFNNDSIPELYSDQYILNALDGTIMGQITGGGVPFNVDPTGNTRAIAVDVLPDTYCAACSGLELVNGNTVYSVDISAGLATINTAVSFGAAAGARRFSTFADFDNDSLLDIVTITDTDIFIWNPRTSVVINSVSLNALLSFPGTTTHRAGRVSIGDIDNDGDLDFVFTTDVLGNRLLCILDNNLNLLWSQSGLADGSLVALPTIFDLNGDGNKEIIYRPESIPGLQPTSRPYLFVFDAVSGAIIDSIYARNETFSVDFAEVIADGDGDGEAEIYTIAYPDSVSNRAELMVISSCETIWTCARNVWNQYNYHPSFVNDNLTIPRQQQNHGAISNINNWGNQVSFRDTAGNYTCPLPDVTVSIDSIAKITCDTTHVFVTVCNDGRKPIQEPGCFVPKSISYYIGDPLAGGTLITSDTLSSAISPVNSCISFDIILPVGNQGEDVFIVVNDDGTDPLNAPNTSFTECNTSNNFVNGNVSSVYTDSITICDGDSVFIDNAFQFTNGVFRDTLIDISGCDSIITIVLTVISQGNLTISPQDELCTNDIPVQLIINDTGGIWIGSGIIDSINGIFNPQLVEVGINVISYITSCGDSFNININVESCDIFIPNAFTPNGDNLNENFLPRISKVSEDDYIFKIYNRWGELIFESNMPTLGWNGFYKGTLVQNGVYNWQLFYREDNKSRIIKKTGKVTLVR